MSFSWFCRAAAQIVCVQYVPGSISGQAVCFFFSTRDIWWPVWGIRARGSSSKGTVSLVPSRFGDKAN